MRAKDWLLEVQHLASLDEDATQRKTHWRFETPIQRIHAQIKPSSLSFIRRSPCPLTIILLQIFVTQRNHVY